MAAQRYSFQIQLLRGKMADAKSAIKMHVHSESFLVFATN